MLYTTITAGFDEESIRKLRVFLHNEELVDRGKATTKSVRKQKQH